MKKCPWCAEQIEDEAIKCRFCGELLVTPAKEKWYFRNSALIAAFLIIGPFALPLLWLKPLLSPRTKVIVSIIVIIITYFLVIILTDSLRSINKYYQLMFSL